jgi:predicted  nucleic acid-binding Zn-ribbon protein
LRSATDHIASLDKGSRGLPNQAYDALQNENKALHGRVVTTESALMKLHRQHAVIVSELKEMRNTHAEGFQDKVSCCDTPKHTSWKLQNEFN